jgi:uncharacterized delta-60 repeat protein
MLFTDFGSDDGATAVAIQPNGRIVVAGITDSGGAANFALARYLANGAPDNSFDGDGLREIQFGGLEAATDLAIQPDGGIVAVGLSNAGGEFDVAVARLTSAGALDPSFSADGRLTTDLGNFDAANAVALQADGRIVVSGTAGGAAAGRFALIRYQPSGDLDPSFGAGGAVLSSDPGLEESSDVAIQPGGKIVAHVGRSFAFARFTADGSLDGGFGAAGFARVDFGPGSAALALALQPDGRIVGAGVTNEGPSPANFGLVRLAGGEPEPGQPPPPLPQPLPPLVCVDRAATIVAEPGFRTKGTPGNDVIVGTSERDRIKAAGGSDLVCALGGRDKVEAGLGRDEAVGGGRRDVLAGAGGRDVLRGKRGNDRLVGGGGRDLLVGGKGRNDRCVGGPGRDRTRGC